MAKSTTTTKHADVSILKNPRITEKAANASSVNTYLFDVAHDATKSEIGKAFELIYKQKALSINTVTVRARTLFRRGKVGASPRGKKAYVTIAKGSTIDIA